MKIIFLTLILCGFSSGREDFTKEININEVPEKRLNIHDFSKGFEVTVFLALGENRSIQSIYLLKGGQSKLGKEDLLAINLLTKKEIYKKHNYFFILLNNDVKQGKYVIIEKPVENEVGQVLLETFEGLQKTMKIYDTRIKNRNKMKMRIEQ